MFITQYLTLTLMLLKMAFAFPRTTLFFNTTTAVTTATPVTACGTGCGVILGGRVSAWNPSVLQKVVATKIVVIENGTNNTSTSVSQKSPIALNGAIINGTAVATITRVLQDTTSPYSNTATQTFLVTSPTPWFDYADGYALVGETYTAFRPSGYSSDITRCTDPHGQNGPYSAFVSHPIYTPSPRDFGSLVSLLGEIPPDLIHLLASHNQALQVCTNGSLDGVPETLYAVNYLTETSTVYNVPRTSPTQILPAQTPVQISFSNTVAVTSASPEPVSATTPTKSGSPPKDTPQRTLTRAFPTTETGTTTSPSSESLLGIQEHSFSSSVATHFISSTASTNTDIPPLESHKASSQQPFTHAPSTMPYIDVGYSSLSNSAILRGTQTLQLGGSPITVSDKIVLLGPEGTQLAAGDGSGSSTVLLPSNLSSALTITPMPTPTTFVIGSQTVTVQAGASKIQISDQVITAGGSGITADGGTYVSLAPSGSIPVVGGSSFTLGIRPSSVPEGSSETVITLAGNPVTLAPGSPIVYEGTTLSAGSAVTISGTPAFLSPSNSVLVIGGSSITLNAATITTPPTLNVPAKVITIAGKPVTLAPDSPIVVDGTTLVAGSAFTISGTPISLSPSNSILVVGGSSITISSATITAPPNLSASAVILTIAGNPVTLTPGSPIVFGGTTLAAGSTITISGTPVSLSPLNSVLVVGGSNITLSPPTITTPPTPNAPAQVPAQVYTIAGNPVTLAPSSPIVLGGTTLIPGGPALTISGTPISLATSSSYLLVGSTSIPLLPTFLPKVITIGTQVFTANSVSDFAINGQTLIPGSSGITIDGTQVSLAVGATEAVVGGKTESVGLGGLIWSGIEGSVSVPVQTGTVVGNGTVVPFTGDASMIHQRIKTWRILFAIIITVMMIL